MCVFGGGRGGGSVSVWEREGETVSGCEWLCMCVREIAYVSVIVLVRACLCVDLHVLK